MKRTLQLLAVLQPSVVFWALLLYLPCTALGLPGSGFLGNMFVDFVGMDGAAFGLALFGAVWANLLTTCLTLDGERDRAGAWIFDPGRGRRLATVPIPRRAFVLFTLFALPGVAVTTLKAESPLPTLAGLLAGAATAYLLLDLSLGFFAAIARSSQRRPPVDPGMLGRMQRTLTTRLMQRGERPPVEETDEDRCVLTWAPLSRRLADEVVLTDIALVRLARGFYELARALVHAVGIHPGQRHAHVVALWSVAMMTALYGTLHFTLSDRVEWAMRLPPAAYLHALLIGLIWIVAALWYYLGRYRLLLGAVVLTQIGLHWVGSRNWVERHIGGANNTYDLVRHEAGAAPLTASDVLAPLARAEGEKPVLIVVAASGGGILAAGWTATVLTQLQAAYPRFGTELRLLSAVSGGSVGTAFYLASLGSGDPAAATLDGHARRTVFDRAVTSSLAASAFGLTFPDFRRTIFPLFTAGTTDRGRLLEERWRRLAFGPAAAPMTLIAMREAIRAGTRPAVIFNATVLESGERVALTPLSTLKADWGGSEGELAFRRHHPRTHSEFLNGEHRATLGREPNLPLWDLDLWTAARISATFPYVSPAPRAHDAAHPGAARNARFHLVDGGYHDNSGVASALDFLAIALKNDPPAARAFRRVALIEIRARPFLDDDAPAGAFEASWLGPAMGLYRSWSTSQTTTSDTAVNRMIAALRSDLGGELPYFSSFVFMPAEDGPTSWHLSRDQKSRFCDWWESNRPVRDSFLAFVGAPLPPDGVAEICTATTAPAVQKAARR